LEILEIVGLVASGLSIASGLPQVLKLLRTRSAGDLSLATLGLQLVAHVLWIAYSLELRLWPVLMPNLFSFAVVATTATLKLTYDRGIKP